MPEEEEGRRNSAVSSHQQDFRVDSSPLIVKSIACDQLSGLYYEGLKTRQVWSSVASLVALNLCGEEGRLSSCK